MIEQFDAIVIGAGEAGAVVASRAVEAGHRVAMIYREPYGSTCVNTGCVPSKFLIHRARVAQFVRTAARFHVKAGGPQVDLAGIVDEKNAMIEAHRDEALSGARAARHLLTLIEGEARFVGPREVHVADRRLRADKVFIATGMRPTVPPIDGLDTVAALTNETAMELRDVPEHLVVVGGGYIACELGQAFKRYGSDVTIVQSGDHLCPQEEPDVSTLLERAFRDEAINVHLASRALRVEPSPAGVRVFARPGDGELVVEGSHLLLATGRTPNTDGLNLDTAGVELRADGGIAVNDHMETSVPGIWAIGDVNGEQPFTRVCQEEAKVAYANAFEGATYRIERSALGHAIFTDPEIASVGLTEQEARRQGRDVAVGLVTFDQVEKAEIIGETTGLIKYVVERASRRLLGAHVIGPDAANLIYDASIVIRQRGRLDDIAKTVGIFPTLQEGMEGTARGLLRRLAPDEARNPLAAFTSIQADKSYWRDSEAMHEDFSCPACGADLEVKERLSEVDVTKTVEPLPAAEPTGEEPPKVSFQCPACAADFDVEEGLEVAGRPG